MGMWQQLAKPRSSPEEAQLANPRLSSLEEAQLANPRSSSLEEAPCHMAILLCCPVAIARLLFRACATTPWAAFTTARKCTRATRCMSQSASSLMFAAEFHKEKPMLDGYRPSGPSPPLRPQCLSHTFLSRVP